MKRLYIYEKDLEKSVFEDRWSVDLINTKLFGTTSGFSIGIAEYHLEDFRLLGIHEDQEAVYIISGDGEYKLGDETFPVSSGCAVYVPPKTKHSVRRTTDKPVRLLYSHGAIGNISEIKKKKDKKIHCINEKEVERSGTDKHWGKSLIIDKNFETTGDFSLGLSVFTSKEFIQPGTHEDQEAIYVLSGEGEYKLGDEIFPISPGCAVYVPPNTKHVIRCTTDEPVILVYTHGAN
ncbi:cupin domain-containing protein [candidate division KSB1 bacterium]